MYIGEIIKKYRIKNGLSQREFAKRSSLSPSYINTLEKIYNPKNNKPYAVTTDAAVSIAKAMNLDIDEMLKMLEKNQEFNLKETAPKYEEPTFYMCPVYGQISAGQPNWAEENIEGRLPIDTELMDILNPEEYFFLRVNGESMNNVVKNGAFALIHKQDIVEDGEIAVVLVNGYNATLKRFTKQNDVIILEPDSNDNSFKVQVYDKTTSIKVIGKYVGKMEINK